jgi:hypothetical protein
MFAGLCRIERLIRSQSAGLASINLSNNVIDQLFEAVDKIRDSQRADASAAGVRSLSRLTPALPVHSSTSSVDGLCTPSTGLVLEQGAITARYAQVDPKVVRFIYAVQKEHMAQADKDKVVNAIRQLLEPWKVEPSLVHVQYRLLEEIGVGGYGRVYRGWLRDVAVAVKVLNAD